MRSTIPSRRARGAHRLPDAGLPHSQPDRADLLLLRDAGVARRRSPAASASRTGRRSSCRCRDPLRGAGRQRRPEHGGRYRERLLRQAAPHAGRTASSILIGAMSADFLRIMVQAALVLLVALLAVSHFETGVPGAVACILIGSALGPRLLGHRIRHRAEDGQRAGDAEHVVPVHAAHVPDDRCSPRRKRSPAGWRSRRRSTR